MRGTIPWVALTLLVSGCEVKTVGPAEVAAPVQFALGAETDSTLLPVIANVDRVWLRLSRDGASIDTMAPVDVSGGLVRARVALQPPAGVGPINVHADLGSRAGVMFTGDAVLAGGAAAAEAPIAMRPVAQELFFIAPPAVEALGSGIQLDAWVEFVTRDRWAGWRVSFEALDPSLVEIQPDGLAISRGNGETMITASFGTFSVAQRFNVRQRPIVLGGVAPADTTIAVGEGFTLRPFGADANGFPLLPGAVVPWSATGGVTVDTLGSVVATSEGSATIEAVVAGQTQTATILVVP